MPRPLSGNQLDKLGKRLAQPGPISDGDYVLLGQVAQAYQAMTDRVQERLRNLGFEPTTRGFKSTGTLVDKLRRTNLPLKDIQDLAGARIVVDGDRLDQDRVVERIVQAFQDHSKPPRVIDRRVQPSFGYRACHVIVYEDSIPMEIQVRTKLQDTWAQMSEKLGDVWGRGLRYGQGPDMPDAPVALGSFSTRREVVESLQQLAELIDEMERIEVEFVQHREEVLKQDPSDREVHTHQLEELASSLAGARNLLQDGSDRLLQEIRDTGGPL